MHFIYIKLILIALNFINVKTGDVLGCGGFIKSHVPIDFSKIEIKLYTKQGIIKDKTSCAPNNGYYFIPLYDKGDYVLKLQPPPGWSFNPTEVSLNVDGVNDLCSLGKDINFVFEGFGITGKVESYQKDRDGPAGVNVELKTGSDVRKTVTTDGGNFFFTPVFPGKYTVSISHPKWKLTKSTVFVQVAEGNTELPSGSLVVGGFDITGFIKGEGSLSNIDLVLLKAANNNNPVFVDDCDKTAIKNFKYKEALCHVTPIKDVFVFPVVSPGKYVIVPYSKGGNMHFRPNQIQFEVEHNSVVLPESFEVVGYNLFGRVLSSRNGKPLKGAKIFLNNKQVAVTKDDGTYTLDKVKADLYGIKAVADKVQFEEIFVKIDANVLKLPDFYPSRYEVCGNVLSDKSQTITIASGNTSEVFITSSVPPSGKFCQYLSPGKYQMHVAVSEAEKVQGIQFFPISHTLEVTNSPVANIMFSQLKSTITGKVECIKNEDCKTLKVVLRPIINDVPSESKDVIVGLTDNLFTFQDVRPGNYEIFLTPNKFCWKEEKHVIMVNTVAEVAPSFVQSGYSVIFISPHSAKVTYNLPDQKFENWSLHISKGRTKYCVEKPGSYEFAIESCHTYTSNIISFKTDSEVNEIYLTPIKHEVKLAVASRKHLGDLYITVNINGVKTLEGPLPYADNQYILTLSLQPGETAILVPQSEILYVNPPILSISGHDDCTNLGVQFKAVKGRVFRGKIIPSIQGALITIETENSDSLMTETDAEGKYKFPPQDDSKQYKITAKKDTYVLVGPNAAGDFIAHKLAEVIVEVIDHNDNAPLQGALLSLSGGESYRSNLQTAEDGKITFPSLRPSEYFLRPMMKEYQFEPSSKIIEVKEGVTVNVKLRGKRVAYSGFGQVTTLNGEPEERITIVAIGLNNCSQFSEESTSEQNGNFRIRGLQPYCTYDIKVKASLDEKRPMERAAPSFINAMVTTQDVHNLKFTIFRSTPNTDILVRVYSENPDNYKNLRLRLTRESSPSSVLHTSKIDNSNFKLSKENNAGVLVQVPSVPLDNKLYSIYLESGTSSSRIKAHTQYFTANSSFKYIDIEYLAKSNVAEQNIKQTSIWALLFIFGGLIGVYNIELTLQVVKDQLAKLNLGNINGIINNFRKPSGNEYILNSNDIDEIVQNINAPKRKIKQRKT
ncbi:hypothetical protein RN001_016191 [Aquatica leii]|uniref:Nodal modulator 1 n=1 Tax=Aquatica leii TaxID=1421715 RepID=A0AAN7NX94_9COLE|nr:hypothetical protein RN001_016191 [Aquatica leii]